MSINELHARHTAYALELMSRTDIAAIIRDVGKYTKTWISPYINADTHERGICVNVGFTDTDPPNATELLDAMRNAGFSMLKIDGESWLYQLYIATK